MLTALYCRRLALPALSSLPCPPSLVLTVLCSRSCAHVLCSRSWLMVLFSRSYSSAIISWPCIGIAPTWLSCCLWPYMVSRALILLVVVLRKWIDSLGLRVCSAEDWARMPIAIERELWDFVVYCFACELRCNWTIAFCNRWSAMAHRRTGSWSLSPNPVTYAVMQKPVTESIGLSVRSLRSGGILPLSADCGVLNSSSW